MTEAPMDWDLLQQIMPRKVFEMLRYFEVRFFDKKKWTKSYEPCISSYFLYGAGGSYDFEDKEWGTVYVHNGTLAIVGGAPMESYSSKYAKAYYKKHDSPCSCKEKDEPEIKELSEI